MLWLFFLAAAVAAYLAVYWPALPFPFVFDDYSHVLENRAIRYLAHPRALLESEFSRSRPLPYLTFAISYALSGLSLSGLRIWSLALHLGSALLTAHLYHRWLGGRWGALLAGAVFLLHPLAADCVIYLSARGSLLVLFFLLLALAAHGREKTGPLSMALFFLAAGLAFLSRETAAALLPLLFLFHHLGRRAPRALFPFAAPLVAGGLVLLWLKWGFLDSAWRGVFTIQGDLEISSPLEYLRISLSLWPRLLALFIWPSLLSLDHQVLPPGGWLAFPVLLGLATWTFFLFALFKAWRTRDPLWAAPAWIFLTLLLTHSFFPLLDPFAERHAYIALPGVAWALALGAERLSPRKATVAAILCVLLLTPLFTLPRAMLWAKPSALWLDAHAKAPTKFRAAFNGALSLVEEADDSEGALRLLGSTLASLAPGALSWEQQEQGLGTAASTLRSLAALTAKPASELAGVFPEGFWRELLLLKASGERGSPAWEKQWAEARKRVGSPQLSPRARDPAWVEHSFQLESAAALAEAGKTREAVAAFEAVILGYADRHIPYWTAREALADLYMALGRESEAVEQLELTAFQYKVFKRFPYRLQRKLYELQLKRGDLARATDAIGELVRVYTDNVALRRLYADLLAARDDRHAARQSAEAAFYERNSVSPSDEREIVRP